jgi:uncharacterized protein
MMPTSPRAEPTFNQTMQIGIVVPDLDAAIRTYEEVMASGRGTSLRSGPR